MGITVCFCPTVCAHEQATNTNASPGQAVTTKESGLTLTPAEKAWLDTHPVIDFHTDETSPPYQFVTANGSVAGVIADLLDAMEKRLGIRFRRITLPTNAHPEYLRKGELLTLGIWALQGTQPDMPYRPTRTFV